MNEKHICDIIFVAVNYILTSGNIEISSKANYTIIIFRNAKDYKLFCRKKKYFLKVKCCLLDCLEVK